MRALFILFATLLAGPARAHIGHIGEVAGHGHWAAAGALGAIAIAAGLAALNARRDRKKAAGSRQGGPENDTRANGGREKDGKPA